MLQQNINLIIYLLGSVLLFLLIWNVTLQVGLLKIRKNQKILFNGKSGKNLEKILLENNSKTKELDDDIQSLYKETKQIENLATKGLYKTGIVRFNPFRDIGGDQSFSIAMLDGKNNGVVISSLYSRDGVRVYAKAIIAGQSSKYPLTQEEKYAISIASPEKNNQKKSKKSLPNINY